MEEKPDALGLGQHPHPLFREGAGGSQQGQDRWDGAGENRDSVLRLTGLKRGTGRAAP